MSARITRYGYKIFRISFHTRATLAIEAHATLDRHATYCLIDATRFRDAFLKQISTAFHSIIKYLRLKSPRRFGHDTTPPLPLHTILSL
jgi:hypothetical protein